jgi:light-regulated signal transduction histidine kinase (bacteriophytochrome)
MDKAVKILLLDRKRDAENTLAQLRLDGISYDAHCVEDRESFLSAAKAACPDVILAEFALPQFDGLAALELAKKTCADTPFLFVSSAPGEEAAVESLKQGATDYVPKQRLERLSLAMRRALTEAAQRREQRKAQEELKRKARELNIVSVDLEEFAYAASHDLQEPLRAISLFSRLLYNKYRGRLDAEADDYLKFIESAAQQMSALLEDLLVYAKLPAERGGFEEVDMTGLLNDALFLFKEAVAENGAKITHGGLPVVTGKRAQLSLVFQNLLANALKYHGREPPEIYVDASKWEDCWVISVKDNGIGFDQLYADRVFGLFKRLNNSDYNGTGLGLPICKRIVEAHGGRMWAESRPNLGSTFSFSLPFRESQTQKAHA